VRNLDAIIKAYDVRGTYPDQLDEDLAHEVGGAFVRVVGSPRSPTGSVSRAATSS
jgi:phosphomannomutase